MNLNCIIKYSAVLGLFVACKNNPSFNKTVESERIEISESLGEDKSIQEFIKPYRNKIDRELDSVLAYSVDTYSKNDGQLNTALGNFLADMAYEQANPVFKARTGMNIDAVLFNHGGIRAILSKGDITARTAYKICPFENELVVVKMQGSIVNEMIDYLARNKRAHPISKINLVLNSDNTVLKVKVNNAPVKDNRDYFVLTTDYLYNGGDHMFFFKKGDSLYALGYKIRNAFIDYLHKVDTLKLRVDHRFIKIDK